MSRFRSGGVGARALRTVLVLGAALACLGAAAYAASRPEPTRRGGEEAAPNRPTAAGLDRKGAKRLPRPRITSAPGELDPAPSARFSFSVRIKRPRFQCRVDNGPWRACRSPFKVSGIGPGTHHFNVRVVSRSRRGPATQHAWTRVEPRRLTVEPQGATLSALFPGGPAQQIPVRIANPNSVPVSVTSLTVRVSGDAPGCPADTNLELLPATLSASAPLTLPAGGEVTLPIAGVAAPAIALRELPVNQDACKGVSFALQVDAEGHG